MSQHGIQPERILFIVNPISGRGKHDQPERLIRRYLDSSRYVYRIVLSEYPGHAVILAQEAVQEGTDIIVAVGGDGTVNEVGRNLVGSKSVLGIIPTGSGNGLARHLGIPRDMHKAIEIINRGKRRTIDTGSLNGRIFLNIAGAGFDAHVARKFSMVMHRGFFSYFRIVVASFRKYRGKNFKLVIDGVPLIKKAFLVSFANSSQFGNNVSIDGHASIDDGLLDVCIVKKIPFWKMMVLAPLLFLRRFDRTPYVEIIRAKEISVKRKKRRYVHLDGDPVREKKCFTVSVHPLSLHVIVP
jgi:YegS/Rv2252/BmrU family lipid kinase